MNKLKKCKKLIWFSLCIILKKHKIETIVFLGSFITVLWLELTQYRFYINSDIDFDKINSLISLLSSAYIASYIFWITNYFFKYIKDIQIIYPQLKSIIDNLFSVYDEYIRRLSSFYQNIKPQKNLNFELSEDSLKEIINGVKQDSVKCESLCGENFLTAMQINYDIDLLLKFTIYLDAQFFSILTDIGRNLFIMKHKQDLKNNLFYFEHTLRDVIKLSKLVEKLKAKVKYEMIETIH